MTRHGQLSVIICLTSHFVVILCVSATSSSSMLVRNLSETNPINNRHNVCVQNV